MSRPAIDVYLAPGELLVSTRGVQVRTVLGSCVAVCLWDPARGIGGLNHFLLPRPGARDGTDFRFGTVSTAALVQRVCRGGSRPAELAAAVIGGGHPHRALKSTVGDENVAAALAVLGEHGVVVARQDTGGPYGRRLLFHTGTGVLTVCRLRRWGAVAVEPA